ncbi:MAG: hypothetical protein ACOVOV_00575 [Dolichospermum sp.]
MKTTKSKTVNAFIIGTFVSLYLLVSIISTIHVIDFFRLSNPEWLAISLAIGFELGAAASLAALITLDKMNKTMVWALFIVITGMQMQGNMYYAYTHIADYQGWVELFNIVEWEPIAQKRLLAGVSGAILPLVALGFIKSLVDYIKPDDEVTPIRVEDLDIIAEEINHPQPTIEEEVESMRNVVDSYDSLQEEIKDWDVTLMDGIEDEVENEIEEKIDGLEMGQIITEESTPIEVDVINVEDETGLINSIEAPETMTVYDKNTNNYVPIKEKWVC